MNIPNYYKNVLKWSGKEIGLLCAMSIISFFIIKIFEPDELIVILLVCIPLYKIITSLRMNSPIPSSAQDQEQFSWKYVQSLPLSRIEVLKFWIASNIYQYFPLLIWLLCFQPFLMNVFDMNYNYWDSSIYMFLFYLTSCVAMSFTGIINIVQFPRIQFANKNIKILFYQKTRNFTFLVTLIIVAIVSLKLIETEIKFLLESLELIYKFIWNPWGLLVFVAGVSIYLFFRSMDIWINEIQSYTKINWKIKRDSLLIISSLSLSCFMLSLLDFGDHFIHHSSVLKAVHDKDYNKIEKLIAEDSSINNTNKYGYTALMLAAHEGDLKMFKFLESKGASRNGQVNDKSDTFHDGMDLKMLVIDGKNVDLATYFFKDVPEKNIWSPNKKYTALHLAAHSCSIEMVDFLLARGADVNLLSETGKTALHKTATLSCYPAAVSLFESGANPLLKDKDQKIALDLVRKSDSQHVKQFKYYLEKKTREPASLKNK